MCWCLGERKDFSCCQYLCTFEHNLREFDNSFLPHPSNCIYPLLPPSPTQLYLPQVALAFPAGNSVAELSSQRVTLPRNCRLLEGFVSHDIGIFRLSRTTSYWYLSGTKWSWWRCKVCCGSKICFFMSGWLVQEPQRNSLHGLNVLQKLN